MPSLTHERRKEIEERREGIRRALHEAIIYRSAASLEERDDIVRAALSVFAPTLSALAEAEGAVARLTADNARLRDVVQAAEGYHNARQAWLGNWEPANGPYVDALNDAWLAYHRALANLRERAALDAKEGEHGR